MKRGRLKNKKGFTLAEMLIAMLITSLAGLIALGGLLVGANTYRDILLKSQAQMVMKEYMDSIRSVLIAVSPDSGFEIGSVPVNGDDKNTQLCFASEKTGCTGYFRTVPTRDPANHVKAYSVLVFQPVVWSWNYDTGTGAKTLSVTDVVQVNNQTKGIEPVSLVAARTANGFIATLETMQYDTDSGAFTGTLELESNSYLSSGHTLKLSEKFIIYPLNYHN